MGYSLVIFPGALVRASTHASMNLLAYLKQHGNTDAMSENMLNLKQLNEVLETEKTLARGEAYAESKFLN
jgi:2-methylisocitrate lyase-like PEP mutase family enzyme